ncbi:MAG: hypothetical protein U9N73_13110, partial [Candidatus Auribacterota bacterium]|nr:hypothetical protein [Candidatus Auribacterota bacterium]
EESPAEVRLYEPPEALRAGSDGLDVIRRLIRESSRHLKPGGALIFEIGYEQGNAVRGLMEAVVDFKTVEVIKDYNGHDRVIWAVKNVE